MLTIKLTAAIIACFLFGAALGLSKMVETEPAPQPNSQTPGERL